MDIDINNLHWIAGFLEGEGCFARTKNKEKFGSIAIQANQVQKEPLERLQKFVGCGNIHKYNHKKDKVNQNDYYRWQVCGPNAESLMKLIYVLMSPKRQAKIKECLDWYTTRPKRNYVRFKSTHCRRGHPFSEGNTYIYPDGSRRGCEICTQLSRDKYQQNRVARLLTN